MLFGKSITLIIPCKNEEGSIGKLLQRVPKFVDEVIVMDNNSTDNTAEIARKRGAVVISEKRHDQLGIGYGFAHQKGIKAATGDYLITLDGDGTYPLHQIKEVLTFMHKQQLDFVSCSRFPLVNSEAISTMRKIGVWILNTQVRLLYQFRMHDILSGMWAMNRKASRKLKLHEGGWDLSPEIKLAALQHPVLNFAEYHIDHDHRSNGASKQQLWQTGFNHFKYIFRRRLTTDNPVYGFSVQITRNISTAVRELFLPTPVAE